MAIVTYTINSALDFERISAALHEANIPFTFRKFSDSAFPSLEYTKGFGNLSVAEEHAPVVSKLLGVTTANVPDISSASTPPKRRKIGQILLIAYAVIVTLACLRYWYLENFTNDAKSYNWSLDGTTFKETDRESGIVTNISYDINFDGNFERVEHYAPNGKMLQRWLDLNDDGVYEESRSYNLDGQNIIAEFDVNADGVIDQIVISLESGDTARFLDTNTNGFLEKFSKK